MSAESERIEVSRDTLRAELSQLELRIVDRVTAALEKKADQTHIDQLETRVAELELSRANRDHLSTDLVTFGNRIAALERFRYSIPSVALLSLVVSIGVLVYYLVVAK